MHSTAYKYSIAKAAKIIGTAIVGAEATLADGRVEQEPAMTDRMIARIELALEGVEINGITWKAKTLTDRGRGAQEFRYGADFMGVLEVSTPGYSVRKGFLAQAKMIKRSGYLDTRTLVKQCDQMLKLSPEAYVFLYKESGVEVTSATAVVAASGNLNAVKSQKARKFFQQHLECMIGDRNIFSATPHGLEDLLQKAEARKGLVISATASAYLQ